MANIKPISAIADKWSTVTPARAEDYKNGVNAVNDWATPTANAEGAWKAGVAEAAAAGRFSDGVQQAGTAKWKTATISKGVNENRWANGVRGGKNNYQAGFQPYHNVISSLQLPPRYERGNPQNIDRVRAVAEALHKAKVGG